MTGYASDLSVRALAQAMGLDVKDLRARLAALEAGGGGGGGGTIGSIGWTAVTGKPLTFPPDPHGHDWGEITGKPLAFSPVAHTHPATDVTGLGSFATLSAVPNDHVTNARLANAPAQTIKGNASGVSADPADLTAAQAKALLAIGISDVAGLAPVVWTQEQLEDAVAAMFQRGTHTGVSVSYDDAAGAILLTASGGGGGTTLSQEEVEDMVGRLTVQGTGISVTYDDAGNVLSIALAGESYTTADRNKLAGIAAGATANASDAFLRDRANHTGAQAIGTITGLQTVLDGKQPVTSFKTINGQAITGTGDISIPKGDPGTSVTVVEYTDAAAAAAAAAAAPPTQITVLK